jgi:hypothetical protein
MAQQGLVNTIDEVFLSILAMLHGVLDDLKTLSYEVNIVSQLVSNFWGEFSLDCEFFWSKLYLEALVELEKASS